MNENKFLNEAKARISTVRARTWTLTVALVITLIFAFLVDITTKQVLICCRRDSAAPTARAFALCHPERSRNPSKVRIK